MLSVHRLHLVKTICKGVLSSTALEDLGRRNSAVNMRNYIGKGKLALYFQTFSGRAKSYS